MKTVTEVEHRIHQLDLGCIKFKLTDTQEGKGWSREKANRVEVLYKRFLILRTKHPELSVVPTPDIDDMWHAHILDTRKYIADCNELFGSYLHHFPYFGMRGAEDRKNLEQAFSATRDLFLKEFGEDIVSDGEEARMCGCSDSPGAVAAFRMCGDDNVGYSVAGGCKSAVLVA